VTTVQRRVERWFELISELMDRPTRMFPRHAVANELANTFGTQVSWNWMDPNGALGFDLHTPIPGWPTPEIVAQLRDVIDQHPLICWFAATADPTPMSIGRVPASLVTRTGRQTVEEQLAPIGMQHQLSIPYRLAPGAHRAFVLARGDEDFPDEDLEVAVRLQTLLLLLERQSAALGRCACEVDTTLTGRELAVVRLLADGLTACAMGHRLGISPRTVHRHLQHAYRKLGVSDRLRAVAVAREHALLEEDPPADAETIGAVTARVLAAPTGYPDFHPAVPPPFSAVS